MPDLIVDGELRLFGAVGSSASWGFDGFSSYDVHTALSRLGRKKDITVRLNSPGGIAHEGVAIYNALKSHQGKTTIYVESVASSAASLIVMAGDETVMRLGSHMMIHDPKGLTIGSAEEHEKAIESLNVLGDSIAEIYADAAGMTVEEARELMRVETWMTAKQAVEKKFAHRVEKGKAVDPVAFDYRLFQHTPKAILNLSDARGWSNRAKDSALEDEPDEPESPTMTEAEKAEATRKEAEAEAKRKADAATATAQAGADATARATGILAACTEAGFPAMAAGFLGDPKHTPDTVKVMAAGWKEIAMCVANANKANPNLKADASAYVTAGKTAAEASADLISRLATTQAPEISNHHDGLRSGDLGHTTDFSKPPSAEVTALWDGALKSRYGNKLAA